MGKQKYERSDAVVEQNRVGKEREVSMEELTNLLEWIIALQESPEPPTAREYEEVLDKVAENAESILERLVGPERETQTRLSSRHLICDEGMCDLLAQDLAVTPEAARAVFLGEPWKRSIKMASWALDHADDELVRLMDEYGEETVLEAADSDAKLEELMAEKNAMVRLEGVSRRAMVTRIIMQMAEDHGMGAARGRPSEGVENGVDGNA